MAKSRNPILRKTTGLLGDYVVSQVGNGTVLRERPVKPTSASESQSVARSNFSKLSGAYRELSPELLNGWYLIGRQMTDPTGKRLQPFLTGRQAFIALNGKLLAVNSEIVPQAPDELTPPQNLPTLNLTATVINSVFSLRIVSAAYNTTVRIEGVPALVPGHDTISLKAWKPLGSMDNLAQGGTSVSTEWLSRYKVPKVGMKVALRIVPLSASGVEGTATIATCIVGDTASDTGDTDETNDTTLKVG